MNTSMTVVLPEDREMKDARVVYLLHGLADNTSGWSRYTSVERYARAYGVALVIPEVQRSFYSDMKYGPSYYTFVHDELPAIARRFFGFSDKREKNYIMGLSMGGYGTLKCIFDTPERYAGAATFSAVIDYPAWVSGNTDKMKDEHRAIWGEDLEVPESASILYQARQCSAAVLPKLYMACGTEDVLITKNIELSELLSGKEDYRFESWEGIHNWDFWDTAVKKAFDWLFT